MVRAPSTIGVVAWRAEETNGPMVEAWRRLGISAEFLLPPDARRLLRPGDVALVRLDVLPTLDGVEDGLLDVAMLARRGVRVLNAPDALMGVHDKLLTAGRLAQAGIPHPLTLHVETVEELRGLNPPFVIKPRFGSWGRDVLRCETVIDRERCIAVVHDRPWFRRHGVLVQELVPARDRDLRLLVAGGRVVGAAERRAAPGEWRTNVSLGGSLASARPSEEALALGRAAAEAIGADLVGIDLLPSPSGGHVVLELNGAADFDERYSLPGRNVYADIASALGIFEAAAEAAVGAA